MYEKPKFPFIKTGGTINIGGTAKLTPDLETFINIPVDKKDLFADNIYLQLRVNYSTKPHESLFLKDGFKHEAKQYEVKHKDGVLEDRLILSLERHCFLSPKESIPRNLTVDTSSFSYNPERPEGYALNELYAMAKALRETAARKLRIPLKDVYVFIQPENPPRINKDDRLLDQEKIRISGSVAFVVKYASQHNKKFPEDDGKKIEFLNTKDPHDIRIKKDRNNI